MDEGRIAYIQRLVTQCVEVERSILPIIQRCLDGMLAHAQSISPPADSKLVLDKFLSGQSRLSSSATRAQIRAVEGYAPRQDFPFEDYGSPQASSSADTASIHSTNNNGNGSTPNMLRGNRERKSGGVVRHPSRNDGKSRGKSVVDKLFGHKHSKGGHEELTEDCASLPPSQRCKRLREKIQQLEAELEVKTKAKDGLTKLAQCYKEQPHMGNVDEVRSSLDETNRQLDHLTHELAKFKGFLEEADAQLNVPVNVALNGGGAQARSPSISAVSNGAPSSASPGKPARSSLSEESVSSESSLGVRARGPPPARSGPPPPRGPLAAAAAAHAQPPPIARPDIGFVDEGPIASLCSYLG